MPMQILDSEHHIGNTFQIMWVWETAQWVTEGLRVKIPSIQVKGVPLIPSLGGEDGGSPGFIEQLF